MEKSPISEYLKNITTSPGVYKFLNNKDRVIYVGKAKNLKKRVRSYFTGKKSDEKTRSLVSNISRISVVLVDTESDALLLENNLIKKFKPKYNILLKDGKSYPWICIKNERFPRIFSTRKIINDGSEYFGPYTNIKTINTLLDLINNIYPIRKGNYNLNQKFINDLNNKISLRVLEKKSHFIILGFETENHNSKNLISEKKYNLIINSVKNILKGKFSKSKIRLKQQMINFSNKEEFEKALECKNKLKALENYQSKSMIVSSRIKNLDIYSIISDNNYAYINFTQVSNGFIISSFNTHVKKTNVTEDQLILEQLISQIKVKFRSKSTELCSNIFVDSMDYRKCIIPKVGDKNHLLLMSIRNIKNYKINIFKSNKNLENLDSFQKILKILKNDLNMNTLPKHIECFDNSNFQGSFPSSACVVFKNGRPSKKDYRHFNIKSVSSPDDFASMEEVVFRRYNRMIDENKSLPNLIIIDGGKGQLSSSVKSLKKLGIEQKISIVGIAKRLEEIYFYGESTPLYIDKRSPSLKLIQKLRDEAHRFSLRQYRNRRDNSFLDSELQRIPGIGEKTFLNLMKKFKSLKNIKTQKIEELNQIVGSKKAKIIYDHFNS
ncbi:MAG: excinuclease ABC subunit C [Flavobacteriaceae bacterium]|nr:excinuclease ABC subunit C [Flavobacteriaceae bacterium]